MYKAHVRKVESSAKKEEEKAAKEAADAASREKNLADAKSVIITEDANLPTASQTKIRDAKPFRDQRIKVIIYFIFQHFVFIFLQHGGVYLDDN